MPEQQIPLLSAEQIAATRPTAPGMAGFLVISWHTGGWWKVWPTFWGTASGARESALGLAACWVHRFVFKVEVGGKEGWDDVAGA